MTTVTAGGAPAFFGHLGVAIALGFASTTFLTLTFFQTWEQPTELPNQASALHQWEF